MSKVHDLDLGVREFFEFKVLGYTYKFRMPDTEEMEELRDIDKDSDEYDNALVRFISPIGEGTPSFDEIQKKLLPPHWSRFTKMIEAEFKG